MTHFAHYLDNDIYEKGHHKDSIKKLFTLVILIDSYVYHQSR